MQNYICLLRYSPTVECDRAANGELQAPPLFPSGYWAQPPLYNQTSHAEREHYFADRRASYTFVFFVGSLIEVQSPFQLIVYHPESFTH